MQVNFDEFVYQVDLSDAALHALIETYCREAGVRNLQKHIERIYRKVLLPLCYDIIPLSTSSRVDHI